MHIHNVNDLLLKNIYNVIYDNLQEEKLQISYSPTLINI